MYNLLFYFLQSNNLEFINLRFSLNAVFLHVYNHSNISPYLKHYLRLLHAQFKLSEVLVNRFGISPLQISWFLESKFYLGLQTFKNQYAFRGNSHLALMLKKKKLYLYLTKVFLLKQKLNFFFYVLKNNFNLTGLGDGRNLFRGYFFAYFRTTRAGLISPFHARKAISNTNFFSFVYKHNSLKRKSRVSYRQRQEMVYFGAFKYVYKKGKSKKLPIFDYSKRFAFSRCIKLVGRARHYFGISKPPLLVKNVGFPISLSKEDIFLSKKKFSMVTYDVRRPFFLKRHYLKVFSFLSLRAKYVRYSGLNYRLLLNLEESPNILKKGLLLAVLKRRHYLLATIWNTQRSYICLRKINSFFRLKLISCNLKLLLYNFLNKNLEVHLSYLFSGNAFFKTPFRFLRLSEYKKSGFNARLIIIAFAVFKASLLCTIVSDFIRKVAKKQHIGSLVSYSIFLTCLFNLQMVPLLGCKFQIKGKLSGKLRKSKYKFKVGKALLNTWALPVSFWMQSIYTKYGVFSIKFWLIKKDEFII
jgi:hypothetical protein